MCEQVNQVMGQLASVNKRSREQRTSKQGSKSVDTHSVTTVKLSNSKHMYFSLDKNRLSIEWLRKRLFVHWIYTLIDRILMTRPGRCHWIPNSNIRGKKQMQSTMQISTYRIRYIEFVYRETPSAMPLTMPSNRTNWIVNSQLADWEHMFHWSVRPNRIHLKCFEIQSFQTVF